MPLIKPFLLWLFALTFLIIFLPLAPHAQAGDVLFSVEHRKAQLQTPAFKQAKEYCMARNVKWDGKIPKPISGLKTTKGYGSDNRPAKFAWYAMILGGRALAGDVPSAKQLKKALLTWAKAKALTKGDHKHDTYYALKRYMLPVIVSLSIIDDQLSDSERKLITQWIDTIVPALDKKFDGDVDHNNHRYLADSVLMAWGAYKGDGKLYRIGKTGFIKALEDARADGSLPLETRRGARAVWYMRHALSSLVTIAEIDQLRGGKLYRESRGGNTLASLMNYYITASYSPLAVLPLAAENYIPGPEKDYLTQDMDYMRRRGHDRHYMAFAEAYKHEPTLAAKRLDLLMKLETNWRQRPYIDEYVGGNASCFFWQPEGNF